MNNYLIQLFSYFEQVIDPAGGKSAGTDKKKRRSRKPEEGHRSPESAQLRGGPAKGDKSRLNPAP